MSLNLLSNNLEITFWGLEEGMKGRNARRNFRYKKFARGGEEIKRQITNTSIRYHQIMSFPRIACYHTWKKCFIPHVIYPLYVYVEFPCHLILRHHRFTELLNMIHEFWESLCHFPQLHWVYYGVTWQTSKFSPIPFLKTSYTRIFTTYHNIYRSGSFLSFRPTLFVQFLKSSCMFSSFVIFLMLSVNALLINEDTLSTSLDLLYWNFHCQTIIRTCFSRQFFVSNIEFLIPRGREY